MRHRGTHAGHLVGGNAGPDAGTADDDTARHLARRHRLRHRQREIRVIVLGVIAGGAKVSYLVAFCAEPGRQFLLQREATVVRPNGDAACRHDLPSRASASATTRATVNPSSAKTVSAGAEAP